MNSNETDYFDIVLHLDISTAFMNGIEDESSISELTVPDHDDDTGTDHGNDSESVSNGDNIPNLLSPAHNADDNNCGDKDSDDVDTINDNTI